MSTPPSVPDPRRSAAVLMGFGDFDDPRLAAHPAASANLAAVKALLRDGTPWDRRFPPDRVHVLSGPATAGDLSRLLQEGLGPVSDLLLVYYTGHAVIDADGELYFALPSTRLDDLAATALPYSAVRKAVWRPPTQLRITRLQRPGSALVVLDCHYDASTRGILAVTAGGLAGLLEAPHIATLASPVEGSTAPDPAEGQRVTALTRAFSERLRAGIPGMGPQLCFPELAHAMRAALVPAGHGEPVTVTGPSVADSPLAQNPQVSAAAKSPVTTPAPPHEAPPGSSEASGRSASDRTADPGPPRSLRRLVSRPETDSHLAGTEQSGNDAIGDDPDNAGTQPVAVPSSPVAPRSPGAGIHLSADDRQRFRDALALAFHTPERIELLLDDIGLYLSDQPASESADIAWEAVLNELDKSQVPDGMGRLLRAAFTRYPGNRTFGDLAERYQPSGRSPGDDPGSERRTAADPATPTCHLIVRAESGADRQAALDALTRAGLQPEVAQATNHVVTYRLNTADGNQVLPGLDDFPLKFTLLGPNDPTYLLSALTVQGPDGRMFRFSDTPATQTVADLAADTLAQYGADFGGSRTPVTNHLQANGQGQRLDPDTSLDHAGIRDGDHLLVGFESTAG